MLLGAPRCLRNSLEELRRFGAPEGNGRSPAGCETRWRGRSLARGSHVRTGAQPTLSPGLAVHAGRLDRATYRGQLHRRPLGCPSGCAACAAASRARAELSVREAAVRVHTRYVDAWPQRRRARRTAGRQYFFDDGRNASGEVRFGTLTPATTAGWGGCQRIIQRHGCRETSESPDLRPARNVATLRRFPGAGPLNSTRRH